VARNLSDGTVANTIPQDSAVALNFQIGDLDGDGSDDYVVSDVSYLPCTPPLGCVGVQNSGRVLALNGTTGGQLWSQVRGSQFVDPTNPLAGSGIPLPYGLLLTPKPNGADVLVGTFIPDGSMELERLNGALNLNGPGGAGQSGRGGGDGAGGTEHHHRIADGVARSGLERDREVAGERDRRA